MSCLCRSYGTVVKEKIWQLTQMRINLCWENKDCRAKNPYIHKVLFS